MTNDKYNRKIQIVRIGGRYYEVYPERRRYTQALQDMEGKFRGRTNRVRKGDGTKYIRIIRELDVNRDNITDLYPGQIIGRVSKFQKGPKPASVNVKVKLSNARSARVMKKTQQKKFEKIRKQMKNKRRMKK